MLKKAELQQQELELVSTEAPAPEKHVLRKIEETVDLGFNTERVARSRATCKNTRRRWRY